MSAASAVRDRPQRRPARIALLGALAVGVACTADFEEPTIVLDLRVLAIQVEPPEIVVPVEALEDPGSLELEDVEICALVADPGATRGLEFELAACPPTADGRCDEPDEPVLAFARGAVDDPEGAASAPPLCGTLTASPQLLAVLQVSLENDPFQGFSSVGVQIELAVGPEGGAREDRAFAFKRMAYAARLPDTRVANRNPSLRGITARRDDGSEAAVSVARCADAVAPLAVASGETVALIPDETPGAREDYVLPTFDGGERSFTENLSYAWLATDGEWDSAETGGPTDPFGNVPPLENEWTAPSVDAPTRVPLWLVQRDERGGLAWYEICAAVEP